MNCRNKTSKSWPWLNGSLLLATSLAALSGCRSSSTVVKASQLAGFQQLETTYVWGQNTASSEQLSASSRVRNPNSNTQRFSEQPIVQIKSRLVADTGEQELGINVTGDAKIFYTIDGSVPATNGFSPRGSTKLFAG
ncbi:hypothetical protein EBR21_16795, partial [bacterium]|nr:hypothetical protein [bacterium]